MASNRLVQLVYASQMKAVMSLEEIVALLEHAQGRNAELGLTGYLCFGGLRFLQLLEGYAPEVNRLYARILADPRHHAVQLIDYRMIPSRSFQEWSMGYADVGQVATRAVLEGVLPVGLDGEFDPYALDPQAAFYLMRLLAQQHRGRTARGSEALAPSLQQWTQW